ncbi:hypothetical protein FA95DRAFT_1612234 [Auriscalpium vulgare]|uniref:Uncharacterized protein n=1 Tax=Auriscalpium vulgare TaxID=40419 RepID=A0ACB8R8A7_9AGAM|nr:hypothetical protein FA95DRAFT_1612234 [Auriscalpium vulgare]
MASTANALAIADRAEIHKSCRALEAVVNLLNDYSEAARAIVSLQKKLAKALRDAASVKPTAEIPGNAFNASAGVFEALADVEAKFAKFVDKESETVSGEVRKWFKKLAKEEKAHDDRIASANVKIKQAGQAYEKKAKKNSYDAGEEHTRYISLLTALGPEISQDKYNHSLSVNQRNTTVTYTVAASLSRVADAEWLRSGECVRRFSPLIGQMGEWKALCEGGWTGALAGDLPDVDKYSDLAPAQVADAQNDRYTFNNEGREQGSSPIPPQARPSLDSTQGSPSPEDRRLQSPTSLANLASFPSPPTHFPLPPVLSNKQPSSAPNSPMTQYNSAPRQLQSSASSSDLSASISSNQAALPRVTESPVEERAGDIATPALTDATRTPPTPAAHLMTPPMPSAAVEPPARKVGLGLQYPETERNVAHPQQDVKVANLPPSSMPPPSTQTLSVRDVEISQADKMSSANSRLSSYTAVNGNSFKKGDYLDEREFGVDRAPDSAQAKAKSLDSAQARVDRTDTVKSNASVVAAMRDKYTRSTGPASPPPRDLPRLPLSVAAIATKYEGSDAPQSPRGARPMSPPVERARRSYDDPPPPRAEQTLTSAPPQAQAFPLSASRISEDLSRRRQRIHDLEEIERREIALELRTRERTLEERARERERERMDSMQSRGDEYGSDASRSPQPPFARRPLSQQSMQSSSYVHGAPASLASRYSYSTTNLPSSPLLSAPGATASPRQLSTSPRALPAQLQPQRRNTEQSAAQEHAPHAADCDCPACTVARYARAPVPARQQEREKPKGWMRRLSMPVVGNAFSSDAKKDKTYGGGKGLGVLGEANRSVTSFGKR